MIEGLPVGETWAVVSDIHGNAHAFQAALPTLLAADRVVVLGDMLTYGAQPQRCMDLLAELADHRPLDLVLGNHDQLYLDLSRGQTAYYERLPDWLREVVDWTAERVDPAWFHGLSWAERVVHDKILLAHANPWPYPDWRYLNRAEDCRAALRTLADDGFRLGLFGHTHRPMIFNGRVLPPVDQDLPLTGLPTCWLLNPGSLGQGRTADNASWFATLRRTPTHLQLRFLRQPFDVVGHRAAIEGAGLSERATARLLRYLPG